LSLTLGSVHIQRYYLSLADPGNAFFITTDYFAALLLIIFSSIASRLKKLNNEKMAL
jgi:hypothetical protein